MSTSDKQLLELPMFLNTSLGVVGKTASTRFEPNTTSKFHFWISGEKNSKGKVEIGNIIAAYYQQDGHDSDITFGIVTEMRNYSDTDSFISDFLSHDFGNANVFIPTTIPDVIVVTCQVMGNISGKTKPVEKSNVYYPSEIGIRFAYGIINRSGSFNFSGKPIPIGLFENGDGTIADISVDDDFLIGPEAAHLNVSGISGLASKTSSLQFIMKSLLTKSDKRIAIIMFNVKSKDLLFIDKPNPKLHEDKWSLDAYTLLNIPITPFENVRFYAPSAGSGTISERTDNIEGFSWTLDMLKDDIPDLFENEDWDDKMEGLWYLIREYIERGFPSTYSELLTWVLKIINDATSRNETWPLGSHISTWRKMNARLKRFPNTFRGLINLTNTGKDIPISSLSDRDIMVIDFEKLEDRGKKLIFGRIVNETMKKLNKRELKVDRIIIFVDELNKFAPSTNIRSPLKRKLIEITARGRSLGLILFGAEQFSSSVDKEIIENSSTFMYGRTGSNELGTSSYSRFSEEIKSKISMQLQGQLLASFAKFPQPIFIKFPYPPCPSGDNI